ncbi:aldo/keto reductase [Staphylococcus massiliensis]|uniref:aldo/keto reductase n=1 Tax=Staphylococcus massiliensis TaxID=555791 RepID=UPI001EDFAF22|nr:aldo/keto reductase [Staphylococcus massiliensis]MCG3399239.1 aldo/keto reductase [Staphylococcus massiliensis]
MNYITLNNDVKMPQLGLGVFRINDHDTCRQIVEDALEVGYRHIDTAQFYQNEKAVGEAIQNSDVPREELFITSKLWVTHNSYDAAKLAFQNSLNQLGVEYIDLFVIHQPFGDYYGAWRAMEELYEEGKIRAIGVDNFNQVQLAEFMFFNKVKPAVNFLETNLFCQRKDDVDAHQKRSVNVVAWSQFGTGNDEMLNHPTLKDIGEKHNKSVAQVTLRWLLQRGLIVIPKTTNKDRLKENLEVFDFELSDDEMKQIAELDKNQPTVPWPKTADEIEAVFAQLS